MVTWKVADEPTSGTARRLPVLIIFIRDEKKSTLYNHHMAFTWWASSQDALGHLSYGFTEGLSRQLQVQKQD